jgi:NADPH:quinone reductase
MKACVVQELSGPSGIVYTDIDDVTGEGGNVLIDVRAAGVCFPDLLLSKGEYQLKLPPPFVPGMETAGVVRAALLTSGFRAGERVSAFGVLGGYADHVGHPNSHPLRLAAQNSDR